MTRKELAEAISALQKFMVSDGWLQLESMLGERVGDAYAAAARPTMSDNEMRWHLAQARAFAEIREWPATTLDVLLAERDRLDKKEGRRGE